MQGCRGTRHPLHAERHRREGATASNKLDGQLDEYAEISRKVAGAMKVRLCDLRKAFLDHEQAHNPEDKDPAS